MSDGSIAVLAVYLLVLFIALTIHEYGHALMGKLLGDDTAQRMGRLTLNPLAHLDPVGSVVIPLLQMTSVLALGVPVPLFGYAKPVPFSPNRFRRSITMRGGSACVALAGPAANILLALLTAIALGVLVAAAPQWLGAQSTDAEMVVRFLRTMLVLNVGLAFFNLIPVPPLDGGWILAYIVPAKFSHLVDLMERHSFVLLIVAMVLPWYLPVGRLVAAGAIALVAGGAYWFSRNQRQVHWSHKVFHYGSALTVILFFFEAAVFMMGWLELRFLDFAGIVASILN